ncbi:unnamed protein product [Effrenium voratum]|uniref:VHS domain-containing protein n=1 Tax=Effrenium voratum TaxID=2562239 RepID=A0AA36MSM0_9DINO|nr:unnamed protein product [Effrenium voratum]
MSAARELNDALSVALSSSSIEWAVNVQICDLVKENQYLAPLAMSRVDEHLRKESARAVQLALSLLEMLIKNCGLLACRAVTAGMAEALVAIVKKRESWRYGFGRNLHKSGFSDWLPQGVAIGEDKREQWRMASQKVLEIMQLCVDAFLQHEGSMRPIFNAYKQLRQEGYQFPRSATGVAADLCLVNGAEDSPAYLAGATSSLSAPRSAPTASASWAEGRAEGRAEAEREKAEEEIVRMVAARADASERVEVLVQALEQGSDFDPAELEELITLVEDISEVLRGLGVESDEAPAANLPPPPVPVLATQPSGPTWIDASPELLISGSAPASAAAGPADHFSGGSPPPRTVPAPARVMEDGEDPLFEAPSHHAGESLLGGRKKKPVGSWSQWASSMRSMTGTSSSRRLGDGVPRSVYAEMGSGNDDAMPLFH